MFGKTCQIQLKDGNSASVFNQLTKKLGHRNSDGNTISWLMKQAEPAVQAVIAGTYENTKLEEISSGSNKIWAFCDEVDGMPRLYAKMKNLFLEELKAEVTFLEPDPVNENERKWFLENNLPMACGRFKESTLTTAMEISEFSHAINCVEEKLSNTEAIYNIFPKKGEVWAVFKDWNVNWTFHDYTRCTGYEMVEVVSDLCEQSGIRTVCLDRVGGIGTVFEKKKSKGGVVCKSFLRTELLQFSHRFSHRVPALKLKGEELDGVLCELWKLDSAAVPLNLL
ncbi:hypothetical protein ACHQM5_010464 [Ranunculus cassubicifolius]